ncbi:MAG: Bifunctional phosphoglucose/phosphomannose isomerase [Candidatus Woesebacteria bacterium GW2011_GWB1_45_5]|uniref:Bifunctional phosphoglucose/phosphomannose isomerase n=1 Tax=Candidatus Woesebacteria bacterium GW2011_GWB1_45_5 TaxID=1618581 RepID=A0A0G1MNU3_9BACT|nr:MAG: Bifunctional phosphoglucose/phosphomannose isomerase [Candidatus Woesebacteria bacterium GW2011_GWB1_45_5]
MGGSSLAGRIIAGAFEDKFTFPITVHNDYNLPAWADSNTLLIANSYSGNTEETISSITIAQDKGIEILGIATGGIMGDMIAQKQIKGVVLRPSTNPPKFPKSALGVSLGALLGVVSKSGLVQFSAGDFEKMVGEIDGIRTSWLPESPKAGNTAKSTAEWLRGAVPVLFASRPVLGGLHAGRNVINEIGRTFSAFFDLPELNHHLVEALSYPKEAKSLMKYLLFTSTLAPDRVKVRYGVTERLFIDQGLNIKRIELKGTSSLSQSIELAHFCGWVAYYLSLLNNEDPGPEPWIIKLKEALSQPVH